MAALLRIVPRIHTVNRRRIRPDASVTRNWPLAHRHTIYKRTCDRAAREIDPVPVG